MIDTPIQPSVTVNTPQGSVTTVTTSDNSSGGSGKWYAGFIAAFAATYTVDHLQRNYGIDFKEIGTDPAVFKALIEGSFVSFLVWLTPSHLVQSVTTVIVFAKDSWKQWRNAINQGE